MVAFRLEYAMSRFVGAFLFREISGFYWGTNIADV